MAPSRSTNGNGQTAKLIFWLLGALLTAVIALAGAGGAIMRQDVRDARQEAKAAMEALHSVEQRLARIETRVDLILSRLPK